MKFKRVLLGSLVFLSNGEIMIGMKIMAVIVAVMKKSLFIWLLINDPNKRIS
jgi:hypothetical protein